MKKCAVYTRIATADECPNAQLAILREAAQQRGLTVVAEFSDIGCSGAKARRPGLQAMLQDARKQAFSVVMCVDLGRIARSSKHLFHLIGELDDLGIGFISLREGIDTDSPDGRVLRSLIRSIKTLESDLVSEQIRAGMRRRRLEGFPLGRPPLIVDRQAVVHDRLVGMSLTQVARRYGVSRASVLRLTRAAERQQFGDLAGYPASPDQSASVELAI